MQNRQEDKWIFLCNVRDVYELELLKNVFAQNEIPVLHKSPGAGAYTQIFMGIASTGYDLYVPNKEIDFARALIEDMNEVPENDDSDYNNPDNIDDGTGTGYILRHRSKFKKLFLFLAMIPLLVAMFYWMIDTVRRILID